MRTRSPNSAASSSSSGAIARQGGHQAAEKSTTVARSLARTTESNVSDVTAESVSDTKDLLTKEVFVTTGITRPR